MAEDARVRKPQQEEGGGTGWLVAALVLLGGLLLLVCARLAPTPARGEDAPAADFSAGRAVKLLRTLAGEESPHPLGSPANAAVRERILAALRGLGLEPKVEEGASCEPSRGCGRVADVVARIEGQGHGKAVMLTAHYDSVPAGPGIADDLSNVAAVLEVARALRAGPALRNPVLLLLDDGEEDGLLGAKVFEGKPEYRDAGAVVNLEARGTSGPSLMFETSGDAAWVVPLYARAASHPVTSSVFATIYSLLPNNTDLSIYKRDGLPGLNFAFIEGSARYHTARDNLSYLDAASVQHQGDNALSAVRALASADLAPRPAGQEVFFDLLGATVVHWAQTGVLRLAELVLLVLALAVPVVLVLRRWVRGGAFGLGLLLLPGVMVLTAALGYGLALMLSGALIVPWVANPGPALTAFWMAGLTVSLAVSVWLAGAGSRGLWLGVWSWWAWLGLIVSAMVAPGIGYLFLVPAVVAALCAVPALRPTASTTARAIAALLPCLAAGLLWLPVLLPLYAGLGGGGLIPIAVLVAVLTTTLGPLVALARAPWRGLLPAATAVGTVVAVVMAGAAAPYAAGSPARMNIELHQDAGAAQARWLVRALPPLPDELRKVAAFSAEPVPPDPWSSPASPRAFVAPAPPLAAPAPELTVVASEDTGDGRRVRLRLVSRRGAQVGLVLVPGAARVKSVTIDGQPALPEGWDPLHLPPWVVFADLTVPAAGCEIEMVLGEKKPLEWYVADRLPGLPPGGEALRRARPAWAAPVQEGDSTLVSRKVTI